MRNVIVGLVADPGLPEKVINSVAGDLQERLNQQGDHRFTWDVQTSRETLPLNPDGEIPFRSLAKRLKNEKEWDFFVYLTDLPRSTDGSPMLAEIDRPTRAALISLPALGAVGLASRVRTLILTLLHVLQEEEPAAGTKPFRKIMLGRVQCRLKQESDAGYLTIHGRLNRIRLLTGMVRNNRPGRLMPALSSSIAAAAATGAFGIFYASIWNMADALAPIRLLMISVLAIAALSGWLIVHNGLWNRVEDSSDKRETVRDNTSTVLTVLLSVTLMYATLYVIVFCGAVAVISSDYLESQLRHPVNVLDYAKLSWLAASLGAIAGALGSNFDSDEAIREATYSRRQHERRQLADSYEH